MSSSWESYAWIKTVRDSEPAPALPACPDGMGSCVGNAGGGASAKSGDRPPFAVAATEEPVTASSGSIDKCCDAGHVRWRAPVDRFGEWRVDAVYNGIDGESMEVVQFIGAREQAVRWLYSDAGRAWRSNAATLALVKVVAPASPSAGASLALPPATRPAAWAEFGEASWRSDFLDAALESRDAGLWLKAGDVEQGISVVLGDMLQMARDGAAADLARFATWQTPDAKTTAVIRAQSSDIAAMRHVAGVDGAIWLDRPATMALLDRVRRETRHAIYALKWHLDRSRPWQALPQISPVIQSGEPLFPAHAAFPAGHAVLAWCVAEVLGVAGDDMAARAAEVCENRVVGGFHWPSDMAAGQLLGEMFARLLRGHKEFEALRSAALRERG